VAGVEEVFVVAVEAIVEAAVVSVVVGVAVAVAVVVGVLLHEAAVVVVVAEVQTLSCHWLFLCLHDYYGQHFLLLIFGSGI